MSDVVVVDASLALKWILAELDSSKAVMLLEQWTNEGINVIAPALFTYEATNTLHRQVVAGKLTYEEAKQGLNDLFSIGVLLKFSIYEEISAQAVQLREPNGNRVCRPRRHESRRRSVCALFPTCAVRLRWSAKCKETRAW